MSVKELNIRFSLKRWKLDVSLKALLVVKIYVFQVFKGNEFKIHQILSILKIYYQSFLSRSLVNINGKWSFCIYIFQNVFSRKLNFKRQVWSILYCFIYLHCSKSNYCKSIWHYYLLHIDFSLFYCSTSNITPDTFRDI